VAENLRVNPKTFFGELKQRNVYKVAIAYSAVAWLLMQVRDNRAKQFQNALEQSKLCASNFGVQSQHAMHSLRKGKEMAITVMSQFPGCPFLVRVEPFSTQGTLIFDIICNHD
jgi:hypothetical protein